MTGEHDASGERADDAPEVVPAWPGGTVPTPNGLAEVPPRPDAGIEPTPPAEPERIAVGTTVSIERATAAHAAELENLDWLRSLHPAMAGPAMRSPIAPLDTAYLVRSATDGTIVSVIDAAEVSGYSGVANVSIYTDTNLARGGWALEAYTLFVAWLFDNGARLVHHEVLELNKPVQRILRFIGVKPSARYRDHAYAAGRHWDVLVYAYDKAHFDHLMARVLPRVGELVARARGTSKS
jgi:RimJ/RimL family protein N-acetyltransferase